MRDHTNQITWHEISTTVGDRQHPYHETEVLVYDAEICDVVLGSRRLTYGSKVIWVDNTTGDQLPAPAYWAEKPFPAGV